MGKIESVKNGQVRIMLNNCYIRLFVKYKRSHCSEIRSWKLPKSRNFLSMFTTKKIFWAIYDDMAQMMNG